MPSKPFPRVSVPLSPELEKIVDQEVTRLKALGPKLRITRSVAIQSLVRKHVRNLQPSDIKALYDHYLREAGPLKLQATSRAALGETVPARQAALRAAAFELLALSTLENPEDNTIIQHLVEVVELTKQGTGYKALPDAGRGTKLLSNTGSA
jgi:hypothetical protein